MPLSTLAYKSARSLGSAQAQSRVSPVQPGRNGVENSCRRPLTFDITPHIYPEQVYMQLDKLFTLTNKHFKKLER
jgi:hypothetical protein